MMYKKLKQIIIGSMVFVGTCFLSVNIAMAAPSTVINTTDTPSSGENALFFVYGNNVYAQSFVTDGVGGVVYNVAIQDAYTNPETSDHNIQLYSSAEGGTIGTSIGTFESTPTNSLGIMTFKPAQGSTLLPNTKYWIVARSNSGIVWKYNNTVKTGTGTIPESIYRAKSTDNGATFFYDDALDAGGELGTGAWNFNMQVNVIPSDVLLEPTGVSDITARSATLQGRVQNLAWDDGTPGDEINYYLTVSTTPEIGSSGLVVGAITSTDEDGYFTESSISGGNVLSCGTTYYLGTYLRIDTLPPGYENYVILFERYSTTTIPFTTSDCLTLELDEISNITKTGATLRARVQNKDWDNVDSTGTLTFYVDKAEDFNSEDQIYIEVGSIEDDGYFSVDIPTETPLECGTTYYVMADLGSQGSISWFSWSDTLQDIGSFTTASCIDPQPQASYGTSAGQGASWTPITTPTPVVSTEVPKSDACPADQLITQNLKAPSRNGVYNSYTKGIVKEVKILQAHLNRLGFNSGKVDGILGPISTGAIKRMQTFLGTKADGYVGPLTRALINNSCGEKGLQKS